MKCPICGNEEMEIAESSYLYDEEDEMADVYDYHKKWVCACGCSIIYEGNNAECEHK